METNDIKGTLRNIRAFFATNTSKKVEFRMDTLNRLKKSIIQHESEIREALFFDLHKSYFELYSTEISLVLNEIDVHLKHIRKWAKPEKKRMPPAFFPSRSMIMKEPYGVVLIISPWNYPFQLLMSPLVAAISAGNCAVLKTSPYAPAISAVVETIVKDVFRADYVAVFHGNRDVNTALLAEKFDYIFFTGSPSLGRVVMTAAAKNLTPVTLELGGKSPCIIDRDADPVISARRVIWGKTLNAGQTCIAPDYLLVHKDIKKQFVDAMQKAVYEMFGDNPQQSPDYPRIISGKAMQRLTGYLSAGHIVFGGRYDNDDKYIEPTVIEHVPDDSALLEEEIFGPIFPLITFNDIEEAIAYINRRNKPLALYFFSNNKSNIGRMLDETSSGGVCINDTIIHVANHRIPFGGIGNSGMGSYHGKYGFETFTHKRAVVKSTFLVDIKLKYPPYKNKLKTIKRFL